MRCISDRFESGAVMSRRHPPDSFVKGKEENFSGKFRRPTRRDALQSGCRCDLCAFQPSSGSVFCDFPVPRRLQLNRPRLFSFLAFLFCFAISASAQMDDAATRRLAHDIFKQLIEINTTDSVGSVTAASEAMAQRFREAGFPDSDIQLLGPNDRKKNVVVRLHRSRKHDADVLIVNVVSEGHCLKHCPYDLFEFVEPDGYCNGRGT